MKMYDVPRYNRPNVRLKRHGVKVLSDAELLAIILGRGNKEENAVDLSNRVLKTTNFNQLETLTLPELQEYFKDEVKAMKMMSMFEIFRRTNQLQKQGFKEKVTNARDVFNRYVDQLKGEKQEHFIALYLDTKNKLIQDKLISKGTLNASLIHPREVFNYAIKASANSIILVHNHPSGDATPSTEDEVVTKNLANAGELLGIHVLDHVIIGEHDFTSLREKGIL